ncbi:MAG: hypothetical protein AB1481_02535, partial [Candidatus Omnitrophota bacterium]
GTDVFMPLGESVIMANKPVLFFKQQLPRGEFESAFPALKNIVLKDQALRKQHINHGDVKLYYVFSKDEEFYIP